MKNIIFPLGAIALIILAFSNRKTIIEPEEIPKIDLTLEPVEPVGTKNIDETPILEKYIQNSLKDPESKFYQVKVASVIAGGLSTAYILLQEQEQKIPINLKEELLRDRILIGTDEMIQGSKTRINRAKLKQDPNNMINPLWIDFNTYKVKKQFENSNYIGSGDRYYKLDEKK
jgi:hypothetical protein